MRILINCLSARMGGGRTYLINLLGHLPARQDLDILVYAPASLHLPDDRRIRRGVSLWPTENPVLRTIWEIVALPRILKKENIQILFCPGGVIASDVPLGCKTVTMFRNMLPFDPVALGRIPLSAQRVRNFILKRVMLRSMAKADLTIFISDYARRAIETLVHVRNPITIPHGIGANFITHSKTVARPAWLPKEEYILYVSRFDSYKHQFEVVAGFAAMPSDLRRQYKLLLVGETQKEAVRKVTDFYRERGLAEQVIILGPMDYSDLPAAYHHATINLFASSCENCPNILLESLGAGRPVLSSNIMPMPEFGAEAVEYFSPSDPSSICDALVRILRNSERRNELAVLAARRSSCFDWASASRRTWQAIGGLLPK